MGDQCLGLAGSRSGSDSRHPAGCRYRLPLLRIQADRLVSPAALTHLFNLICFLVRPENVWVFVAFYVIAYLGMGVFNILIWACIIDVIDYSEVKNHIREDGTIYSCYSFARKLGQAASSGLSGALITMVGYTDATKFDPEVTNGIFNIACLVPVIGFVLVALTLIFLYPLSRKVVESNSAELERRRAEK